MGHRGRVALGVPLVVGGVFLTSSGVGLLDTSFDEHCRSAPHPDIPAGSDHWGVPSFWPPAMRCLFTLPDGSQRLGDYDLQPFLLALGLCVFGLMVAMAVAHRLPAVAQSITLGWSVAALFGAASSWALQSVVLVLVAIPALALLVAAAFRAARIRPPLAVFASCVTALIAFGALCVTFLLGLGVLGAVIAIALAALIGPRLARLHRLRRFASQVWGAPARP